MKNAASSRSGGIVNHDFIVDVIVCDFLELRFSDGEVPDRRVRSEIARVAGVLHRNPKDDCHRRIIADSLAAPDDCQRGIA